MKCQKKTDFVFVIDRSGSIKDSDYKAMRKFLNAIGHGFQIGERNSDGEIIGQGAIVTFSDNTEVAITLKESQQSGRFGRVVTDEMLGPEEGSKTHTNDGLKRAYDELTTPENGFRSNDPDVHKQVILITDGQQTKPIDDPDFDVTAGLQPFHDKGIEVLVIGVGLIQGVQRKEIETMVSKHPDTQSYKLPNNYRELMRDVSTYIDEQCPGTFLEV